MAAVDRWTLSLSTLHTWGSIVCEGWGDWVACMKTSFTVCGLSRTATATGASKDCSACACALGLTQSRAHNRKACVFVTNEIGRPQVELDCPHPHREFIHGKSYYPRIQSINLSFTCQYQPSVKLASVHITAERELYQGHGATEMRNPSRAKSG